VRGSKGVTLAVLLVGIVLGAAGHGFLASGMRRVGSPEGATARELLRFAARTVREGRVLLGVLLQMGFFASYLVALSRADLSFVLPVTALDFVLAILVAVALGERLTAARWLGTLFIALGVALVAWTQADTLGRHVSPPSGIEGP
jgi:drug/metabolite transporter (DMT)-like permease